MEQALQLRLGKKRYCPSPTFKAFPSSAQKHLHFNNNVLMSSYSQHFKASSRTPGMLWDLHRQLYCPFHSWERMCLGHINRSCVLDMTKYENESFTPQDIPRELINILEMLNFLSSQMRGNTL